MVSTHPLISKLSCPHTNPLVTVPSAPITIGITVTFMFYSFFGSNFHLVFSYLQDSPQYSSWSYCCSLNGLILLFLSSPVPVPIHWWLYRVHQLQSVSPSLLCFIVFPVLISSFFFSRFLTILQCVFTQDLVWRKVVIIYIYILLPLLGLFFLSNWLYSPKEISSSNFCISVRLGVLGILLMCLSISFLVIRWASIITRTQVDLSCYIFLISLSISMYLIILLYSLKDILSVGSDISLLLSICLFYHIYQPLHSGRIWHKVNL